MTLIVVFMFVVVGGAVFWLVREGALTKPWLEVGVAGEAPFSSARPSPAAASVGLVVFLTVLSALFVMLGGAYAVRMQSPDWRPLPLPSVLWLNTGLLVLSCGAMQWAVAGARENAMATARTAIGAAGILAMGFLIGQIAAWQQLARDGYLLATNPANSFFFLITGLHGLHVIGGLVILGVINARIWSVSDVDPSIQSVRLCSIYWHFLLGVWILFFAVLTGRLGDFIALCQQVLT